MIIKHLELKNQDYNNLTLNGISVKCFLNGLAGSGATSVDFSKTIVKVILTRNDIPHVITMDNLKILGLASNIDLLDQQAFATNAALGEQLVAGQTAMVSFKIGFGGHINLRGDDKLYIEVQNTAGLFTNPALEAASYLEIKPMRSVGVEKFLPRILTKVIQAGEQSNQYAIGDNLIRLVILNFDKTDFKNNVIQNLIFSSDRLNDTFTYADLVANKMSRFGKQLIISSAGDVSSLMQEDQSFVITDMHQEFDQVSLEMQFNADNVVASQNYIVAWTYETNWTILQVAAQTEDKHQKQAVAKIEAATSKKS